MRSREERRFLTRKAIRRHIRINSVSGRKHNYLPEKMKLQPHRLYKGRNYDNHGGYAYNTKNLGQNRNDLKNTITAKEQLDMMKE